MRREGKLPWRSRPDDLPSQTIFQKSHGYTDGASITTNVMVPHIASIVPSSSNLPVNDFGNYLSLCVLDTVVVKNGS